MLFGLSWVIYTSVGVLLVGITLAMVFQGIKPKTKELEIPVPDDPSKVNRTKAIISTKGFLFEPYLPKNGGIPIAQSGLHDDEELILVERKEQRHLYLSKEMAYHHLAQNKIAGEPYMVSF